MAEEWTAIGRLADLTPEKIKYLRKTVGFYRFIDENGKEVYLGKAVEFDNGGIAKRLMDYIRPSDSARRHGSGRAIHGRKDTLIVKILKVGDDQNARTLVDETEKNMIEQFKPELNVQHNRGYSTLASDKRALSSQRPQGESRPDAAGQSTSQIRTEVVETGTQAAVAALVMGGALSVLRNGLAYRHGEVDGRRALANVGKDAARSAAGGGTRGILGVGVRHGARHLGVPMKASFATTVAAAIEVGEVVYDFARGEISAEVAGERIGETGCSTAGSLYAGAAVGTIFGPPGAIVGSVAGYLATAWVYQSCMAALQQARLAEEQAARLEALCEEAVQECNRQRQEFESLMAEFLEERQIAFCHCFGMIDEALVANDTDNTVRGLARLAAMTGSALKFEGFEEFKKLMEHDTFAHYVI